MTRYELRIEFTATKENSITATERAINEIRRMFSVVGAKRVETTVTRMGEGDERTCGGCIERRYGWCYVHNKQAHFEGSICDSYKEAEHGENEQE